MTKQNRLPRHFIAPLLLWLAVLVSPAIAQQPPTPPPAPSDPQAAKPKDSKTEPASDKSGKPDDAIGKSKLEKETGTINDRIFEVLPNYGTVESAAAAPPLHSGQKFRLATASVFDWAAYPFNGLLAGIGQAKNDPKAWGQGWDAYAKRYGASFADNSIGTYMTTAIFPSLLKEDTALLPNGQRNFPPPFSLRLEPPLRHPHRFRPPPISTIQNP